MSGDFLALCHQNGLLNDHQVSSLDRISNPTIDEIGEENWGFAEAVADRVIESLQPTSVSEKRRHDVIDYVQNLITDYLNCEVLAFGSVPLKTYLPDGDIDLTAIGMPHSEDALASSVRHVLETEERNNDAEFELKDVQYINAEVKLVKCIVQNIIVDISFNQIGGLSTLCFLEHVDRQIGKNHLFKRSIMLIKAWCYYESRILGAHHGLISTYALETMILYIFHLFHSSLNGPLTVLYKFLDYYSKFDWDKFGVSLYGPVIISSLPELTADVSENSEGDTLFTREFLKNCVEQFSDYPRVSETTTRFFPKKHLNIVDPLKESNNLGRSVGKGNFYRIRSAFAYGARKLGRVLLSPSESIEAELSLYFVNTLERHSNEERPDVYNSSKAVDTSFISEDLCESMSTLKVSCSMIESKVTSPRHGKSCAFPHTLLVSEKGNQKATIESSSSSSNALELGTGKSREFADLSSDFDMHKSNLLRVRYNQECMMGNMYPAYPQSHALHYHRDHQHAWHGGYSQLRNSRVAQPFSTSGGYSINAPFALIGYPREDMRKPRGTGTYFPNTNYHTYKDQNSPGRVKKSASFNHRNRDNNQFERSPPRESKFEERESNDTSAHLQLPTSSWNVKENATKSFRPVLKEASVFNANNVKQGEAELKFGSLAAVTVVGGTSRFLDKGRRSFDSTNSRNQAFALAGGAVAIPSLDHGRRSVDSVNSKNQASSLPTLQTLQHRERSIHFYRLKDEDDFPPLN